MKDFVYNGLHLIVDALVMPGESHVLNDLNLTNQAFIDIATIAEMTIIEQPKVIKFPVAPNTVNNILNKMKDEGLTDTQVYRDLMSSYSWEQQQNSGVTGFTVISESHCALHTWPEQDFFTFCLYSCKSFDVQSVLDYLYETFKLNREATNVQIIERRMPRAL